MPQNSQFPYGNPSPFPQAKPPPGEPPTQIPLNQLPRSAKALGAPAIGPWAKQAKAAWQQTRPFLAAHLSNLGQLESYDQKAENNAKAGFSQAVLAGSKAQPAWHANRAKYLFLQGLPRGQPGVMAFHQLQDNGPAAQPTPKSSQTRSPTG